MCHRLRLTILVVTNATLLASIVALFWYQDWRYSLPTPRPDGLFQPELGSRIELPAALAAWRSTRPGRKKPILVHFMNPHCPCTQFNIDHVRKLASLYKSQVDFVVALETADPPEKARAVYRKFALDLPMVIDRDSAIGNALGVYSTPQAALLDGDGRLYYRGNYNLSRFCVNRDTEFVRIALEQVVAAQPFPRLRREAFIAYGCPLPRRAAASLAGARPEAASSGEAHRP